MDSEPAAAQRLEEAARETADRGFKAYQAQSWAEAALLFREAESLMHSPMILLYLGRSLTGHGALLEAREIFQRTIQEVLPDDAPAHFLAAQQDALRELADLEARIPKLSAVLQGDAPPAKVTVYLDGEVLPRTQVGLPQDVDPGPHVLRAVYGSVDVVERLQIYDRTSKTIVLRVDVPHGSPSQTAMQAPSHVSERRVVSTLRVLSYVGLGAGAVGLGVGTGYRIHQLNLEARLDRRCDGSVCPDTRENRALKRRVDDADVGLVVGFAAGGALALAGATLWVVSLVDAPEASPAEARGVHLRPWLGAGCAGLGGSF